MAPRAPISVQILDKTYANCVDQTSSRLFYAIAATENMLIFGSDASNAFAEAPPPKQGFFVRPDRAFHEWWVNHKKRPPIPDGHVIPVLSAMQGHPESPRLWENTPTRSCKNLASGPPSTNRAYIRGSLQANVLSSSDRSMTLQSLHPTNGQRTFSSTC